MANLIKYDPFSDAGFDDLFRGVFQPIHFEGRTQAASIRMDVSEGDESYIVHAEMPGVNKGEISRTRSPQRMRFAGYSSSMLSRKKLHGEEAPTKRRHVSALTPSYSNVPAVSSTTNLRLRSS